MSDPKADHYAIGDAVTVTCSFDGIPDEVHFACIRPGDDQPIRDFGSLDPRSPILPADTTGRTFHRRIDTSGLSPGTLTWRMWSESPQVESTIGHLALEKKAAKVDRPSSLTQVASAVAQRADEETSLRRALLGYFATRSPSGYAVLGGEAILPTPTGDRAIIFVLLGAAVGLSLAAFATALVALLRSNR